MYTLLLMFITSACAEIFTSMADMEQMVLSEKNMLLALKHYISAEEKKLQDVKHFMTRVNEALQYVNESDVGKYLGNPVNSYLMLKRFNVDWKNLEKTLEQDVAEDFNAVFEEMKPFFPTIEDHQGAMDALFRLQNTYNLPSQSLAKGIIPGVTQTSKHPLSLQEIYELGVHAYNTRDWMHASEWFQTALNEMGDELEVNSIEKATVMDYLAYSLFQNGHIMQAYKLTKALLKLRPNEPRLLNNLDYFEQELKVLNQSQTGDAGEFNPEEVKLSNKEKERIRLQDYESLCRGEARELTKREKTKMKCWYKWKHPHLMLKPQKVERIWVDPEIRMLRDILTPKEVKYIKDTAYPMLRRATIQDPITGKLRHADYRVSKSAWLSPNIYTGVLPLKLRAEAATGLDLDFAEQLQIANYGIGGHYEPHFDHARDEEDKFTDLNMGNRIATLLFYLSDVKAGGPTVFTKARATVYPSKHDAVFWYNLKRNGDSNTMTRHAACPVLVGQKWVSNWWIHEYGQVFRRRCALRSDW